MPNALEVLINRSYAVNLNVGHGGTCSKPHGGGFAETATAWRQWQIKPNEEAASLFVGDPCGLVKTTGWKAEQKSIP